jgi:hypothetical protein
MICTDGVYAALPGESPRFYPLSPPDTGMSCGSRKLSPHEFRLCWKWIWPRTDTVGEPWLAELYMDGVANRIRTGPRSGQKTSMADANEGLVTDQEPPPAVLRCANYQGFSVHANVAVRASDRKRPGGAARTHVVMERIELIGKLAALVPRPRYHIVHYYGVFAPAAKWRRDIVPDPPPPEQCSHDSGH